MRYLLSLELVLAAAFWTLVITLGARLAAGLPAPAGEVKASANARWWRAAWAVLVGLLLVLFLGYALSWSGHFSRCLLWGSVLVCAAGLWFVGPRPAWRDLMAPALLVAWIIVLLLLCPQRGAWLAGGWDPGIYANEGAAVARGGTFAPSPVSFYQQLGPDLLRTLTADQRTFREVFPGVPVDLEREAYRLQFPRLTSVAFAVMHAVGGGWSGWRTPLVLAAMAWLVWAAVMRVGGSTRAAGWTGAAGLLLQPVFLYHAHTPSSELLELVLVGGLCLAPWCGASSRPRVLLTALLLLAAAANRTSFVLFGAFYMVLLALVDAARADRRAVWLEHAGLAAALAAGAACHHIATPVAVLKLAHVLPGLERTAGVLVGLVVLVDGAASWPRGHRAVRALAVPALRGGLGLGLLLLLGLAAWPGTASADHARAMYSFFGGPVVGLAVLGVVLVTLFCSEPRRLMPLLWCLLVTLVVVRHQHVADLYPWATKRYLAFTVPLLALGCAALVQAFSRTRLRARGWPVLAVAVACGLNVPRSLEAWRATSYDGMPAVLDRVAAQLKGADGVVADHFLWATPLALAWGCPVVNGEALVREPESAATRAVWQRLAELAESGQRICILTTTDVGPAKWGAAASALKLVWTSGPVTYRETFHHRSARGFSTVEKHREFRIYELNPGEPHDG